MGIRALLEQIMIAKVGDHRSFAKNLQEFEAAGYVSSKQKERLETILEAGHATIHRSFLPSKVDLVALVDIAESVIETTYLHDSQVKELRKRIPPRVAIVTDEPWKYPSNVGFPDHVSVHHRSELQTVQKEMMDVPAISCIIYDQTCAAEKRRRRKRGTFPDPNRRVFINELVCEGCGDCGVQSNCVAIAPKETEFGRKRQIDQSACNKDFSCLKGFCPSFVTIEGGELIKGVSNPVNTEGTPFPVLPQPKQVALDQPWTIMITGIGGTGVVTIGHLVGMAANLDGKGVAMIDMAGLSQKNGAVVTHLKLAKTQDEIASIRIAAGGADVLLGCDIVTSASERICPAPRVHAPTPSSIPTK